MPDVTIITVAYSSMAVLPGMAASLPADVPLVVVDNSRDPVLADWAMGRDLKLIQTPSNLGFGTACNLGARGLQSEFLLFLNPDARLVPGCLDQLLAVAKLNPSCPALAPVLCDVTGEISYKWRTHLLRKCPPQPKILPDHALEAPMLSGAAMLVRRAAFEAVGGFDERIFLYYEDDDLSIRLTAAFGPLLLVPQAMVTHAAGTSSPASDAMTRFKWFHWQKSRVYAEAKHGRPFARSRSLAAGIGRLALPRNWKDRTQRIKSLARLHGAWAAIFNA